MLVLVMLLIVTTVYAQTVRYKVAVERLIIAIEGKPNVTLVKGNLVPTDVPQVLIDLLVKTKSITKEASQ